MSDQRIITMGWANGLMNMTPYEWAVAVDSHENQLKTCLQICQVVVWLFHLVLRHATAR